MDNQEKQMSVSEILAKVKEKRKSKELETLKSLSQLPFKSKYLKNDSSIIIDLFQEDSGLKQLTGTETYSILDILRSLYDYIELKTILNNREDDPDFISKYESEIKIEVLKSLESLKINIIKLLSIQDD